jgi:hypothetical protein
MRGVNYFCRAADLIVAAHAEHRFAGIEIAAEQALHALSEQFLAVLRVTRNASLHRRLEISSSGVSRSCITANPTARDLAERQSARISRSLSSTACSSEVGSSPILPPIMSCLIVLTMPVTIEGDRSPDSRHALIL